MAVPNVGNITPRANVCTCICRRGGGCSCDCIQTNEIGLNRNITDASVITPTMEE